jgi:hypothetical protein
MKRELREARTTKTLKKELEMVKISRKWLTKRKSK